MVFAHELRIYKVAKAPRVSAPNIISTVLLKSDIFTYGTCVVPELFRAASQDRV